MTFQITKQHQRNIKWHSRYLFCIFLPLCCLSSSIYRFWLSLWHPLAIVLSVFFNLHILVISLEYVGHCVVFLLRFTDYGYLFYIFFAIVLSVFFDLRILAIFLVSFGHWFVCLLWFKDSGYLFGIFKLFLQ